MKEMIGAYTYEQLEGLESGLCGYMKHYLSVVMMLTMMFTAGGKEDIPGRKAALAELWDYVRERDGQMYAFLRRSYPALVNWLPFRLRGRVMVAGYLYYSKKIKCS